ncbi:hypothetical protein [Roseibium sp. RKSG952]|uniref:hypothetical protein n=1 Tax=Roseibium sp. RKSG952 TaxID=2529384 RepID=UPI0012BCCF39|nr:hypothetical protein [Roseibium sp. RKSG952]MTH96487.1 hypothetical protein [Roseibium sp. RKSG952]
MKITTHALYGADQLQDNRLIEAFELRNRLFSTQWDFKGYEAYPTLHDLVPGTKILVISTEDQNGVETVFGCVRIVPGLRNPDVDIQPGQLAFEEKYMLQHAKLAKKTSKQLQSKRHFDIRDVLPEVLRSPSLSYAEIGGYAMDTELCKRLFHSKEAYVAARDSLGLKGFQTALEMKLDFVIVVGQEKTLRQQIDWIRRFTDLEHRILSGNCQAYDDVMKGDRPLVINISNKVRLNDALRPYRGT